MRQSKYLHNIIEQDHRGVKRISGVETMHMIKKVHLHCPGD